MEASNVLKIVQTGRTPYKTDTIVFFFEIEIQRTRMPFSRKRSIRLTHRSQRSLKNHGILFFVIQS